MIRLSLFILWLCSAVNLGHAKNDLTKAGDIGKIAIPAYGAALTLLHKDVDGLAQWGLSLGSTILTTEIIKEIVDEERPRGGSNKSFPSGHTSAAFSGAAFVHKRYGIAYAVPAYIYASVVGISRVEARAHYVHDVLAGAALGLVLTFLITEPYEKSGLLITPAVNSQYVGFTLNKRW